MSSSAHTCAMALLRRACAARVSAARFSRNLSFSCASNSILQRSSFSGSAALRAPSISTEVSLLVRQQSHPQQQCRQFHATSPCLQAKRKRRKSKQTKSNSPSTRFEQYGPLGRPYMTDEIWLHHPDIQKLHLANPSNADGNAKVIMHQFKHRVPYFQKIEHVAQGPHHDEIFLATMTTSFTENVDILFPTKDNDALPSHIKQTRDSIELICVGAARTKKHAELLAATDTIALLAECGIDARHPPNLKELHQQQFQSRFQKSQNVLELCGASRPRFSFEQFREKWIATASCMLRGTHLLTKGPPGKSKADAEKLALIKLVQEPLVDVLGRNVMEEYHDLIQKSPGGHVATLQVPPLPSEVLDELDEAIGSPQEHQMRMQQHDEWYQQQCEKLYKNKRHRRRHRLHVPSRNRIDKDAINKMMVEEETARFQKATENPQGKQAAIKTVRDALPITKIRQPLIEALNSDHQVVVVSGGTGSGKSTQCPQYVLEDAIAYGLGADTRIVVTQPRRIAAISVAERVAAERDQPIGDSVGYTVRFQRQAPRPTGGSIEFVTTGVLLRRLMNSESLEGVSHIFVDEVHERDINTDFLLILLRDLIRKAPHLRIILMSATLDAESFANYFSNTTATVPVLSVPTQPRHPVQVFHLEDVALNKTFPTEMQQLAKSLLQHNDEKLRIELEEALEEEAAASELEALSRAEDEGETMLDSDGSDSDGEESLDMPKSSTRIETLRRAVSMRNGDNDITPTVHSNTLHQNLGDKFDAGDAIVQLVAKVAQYVSQVELDAGRSGSILCFLPGWDEIKEATEELQNADPNLTEKMAILPLHSTIPQHDQQKVFEPAAEGTVKVILATNIAESSVTINDVLAVVDSGLVRELNYDAESAMSAMETNQASRASATQRLGRAGRVAPGRCYRLHSRGDLEVMSERPTPEIQRTALDATCLQTCSMTSSGVETFLQQAMDPPQEESVSFAMDRLVKLGAITVNKTNGGEMLSPLGRCLARLPVDPAIGRMLIMGVVMQCLDPILTTAACFSSRNTFYNPPGMREEAREIRKLFCDESDIMAMVRAYNEFWDIVDEEGWDAAKEWAFDNFVSIGAMVSIQSVRLQLLQELNRIGLVPHTDLERFGRKKRVLREDSLLNQNSDKEMLNVALWATAFPDNLASRRQLGSFGTLRTRTDEHAGLHPSSVAFYRKPPRGVLLPPWYLYREMVLSSQVFLRGCTAMLPEQILLFGGYSMDPRQDSSEDSRVRGILDDWIVVEGSCEDTLDLLIDARAEINAALEYKVSFPKEPLPDTSQDIIDSVGNMFGMQDEEIENTAIFDDSTPY